MTFRSTRLQLIAICVASLLLGGCGKSSSDKSGKSESGKSGSKSASKTGGGKTNLTQAKKLPPASVPESVVMVDITPKGLKEAIAERKGQAILVDYWATWCKPCKKAFPHTVKLSEKYASKGLVVMSVSVDDFEQRDDAKAFLKSQNAKLLNYFSSDEVDPDERFTLFEIPNDSVPCYKIYKPDGTLLKTISGSETDQIDAAVHEALGLK